jgi:hypothetical protein
MYDLTKFGLSEMIESGRELRKLGSAARSMEEAAQEMTSFFHDRFVDDAGTPNLVLARCFKTHPFGNLSPELKQAARASAGGVAIPSSALCLTLLGTRGHRPEWNDRHRSAGHQAIPLISHEAIARAPMIARLFQQMGVASEYLVHEKSAEQSAFPPRRQEELMLDIEGRHFNVFYVPEAQGSAFIPAQQEFVERFGVRSAIGFGGVLPQRELFAFVLFTRVAVNRETAELFRTLALAAKLVLLPFAGRQIFV